MNEFVKLNLYENNTFIRKGKKTMIDDEIVAKLKEVEWRPHNTSAGEEASKKMKEDIIDMYEKSLGNKNDERVNDPIEQGYDNACKDQNFTNKLNNENDPTAKAYKDFADEIDDHIDDPTIDSNESNTGRVVKRRIDLSITRENGKVIHSSDTIPLNSLLVNAIGATIGNCAKDGDEFKFNLNIEEDGSINLQIHAPNNKMNDGIILKLFECISDENKMNSNLMSFIHMVTMRLRQSPGPGPSPWGAYNDPRWRY